ncbi:MAG: hypothetical protein HFJ65_05045 [Eggerthellaceae bacterium]|nr:hypothetical protein [Eggerthellaceae bacterium]
MDREPLRIGLMYESDEWSDHKLAHELELAFGDAADITMICMEDPSCVQRALACQLLISRVFASAQFRGHLASLERMEELIPKAAGAGVRMLNPGSAHAFEVSKHASMSALKAAGICVPEGELYRHPQSISPDELTYPCIIKPDCGGRTTHTARLLSSTDASAFLRQAPDIPFIVQRYIQPERGFITRVEIVGGSPELIVKRSVTADGLSAYRLGSTYEIYEDVPAHVLEAATKAARTLGFTFGSFDVIETDAGAFFIDANSVSNVSEDNTEMFGMDLMAEYAKAIFQIICPVGAIEEKGLA